MSAPRPIGQRLALIHGNSLPPEAEAFEGPEVKVKAGGERPVLAIDAGSIVLIQRHGPERRVPAHLVDHGANIRAACELGCDRVLALGSSGSLKLEWGVGTVVCPDDFYAPEVAPSYYDDPGGHSVPGFDRGWRRVVVGAWGSLTETPVIDGGVYAQTRGPRFETPAEVRALARHADLVGMTIAAEAILAREATLAYAAICTIDNLANGIAEQPLTLDEYRRGRDRTGTRLLEDLQQVLPALAREQPST
ncbi:MAG: MTAP family purine nucleoside phosphorylase [Solirubrobacterales bacterium]